MALAKYLKRSRLFYGFINVAFNQYDHLRVKQAGPDQAAAEWIMKNEGWVRTPGKGRWIKDYNSLTGRIGPKLRLGGIQAIGLDITSGGCSHFKGLKHVEYVDLSGCVNIGDAGMRFICDNCNESLRYLDVSGTSVGLTGLEMLRSCEMLQTLKYDENISTKYGQKHDSVLRELMERNKGIHIEQVKC